MTLTKHSQRGKLSSHGHGIEIINYIEMVSKSHDTTAESPSPVTLSCPCRVLLVLLILVFLRLLEILRVLCVLLGVLGATQQHFDISVSMASFTLCICVLLFHMVS